MSKRTVKVNKKSCNKFPSPEKTIFASKINIRFALKKFFDGSILHNCTRILLVKTDKNTYFLGIDELLGTAKKITVEDFIDKRVSPHFIYEDTTEYFK